MRVSALFLASLALLDPVRGDNAATTPLDCGALARIPVTASCELDVTDGFLKIGEDGQINNANGRTLYYKTVQGKGVDAKALTTLIVAGDGPGLPLAYLDNYKYLACHKGKGGVRYKVVLYDPVGVGQSKLAEGGVVDESNHSELLSLTYRGREFQSVAENFAGGRPFVAVGHGTGAATVVQSVLAIGDQADKLVKSAVLASPVLSCGDHIFNLKSTRIPDLPAFYADVLLNAKNTDPFYENAVSQFNSTFYCRISNPTPSCVSESTDRIAKDIFTGMWGSSFLSCTGTLAKWTDHKRLNEIRVPTYVFAMEHDTVASSALSKVYNSMDKKLVRGEILPLGGHLAHIDAFAMWYSAMTAWLDGTARAGEFVNVASPASPPTPVLATTTVTQQASAATATQLPTVTSLPTNTSAPTHVPCHCPTIACDGTLKASVAPLVAGFFLASLIMTPVGYGLHGLVRQISKKGVFAQHPENQYHTLTNMATDDEGI